MVADKGHSSSKQVCRGGQTRGAAADKDKEKQGSGQARVLPKGTPPQVLELMLECWSGKPRERPQSFTEIRERLSKMLEASDDELGLGHRLAIEGPDLQSTQSSTE